MKDYNFDRLRLGLFQESRVYDTLLSNDMYPQFANSFLLVIGKEQPEMAPVYVKFSNERQATMKKMTLKLILRKCSGLPTLMPGR